jgi:DNA-directed RNA polymerase subunit RPC12/RpoP
MFCPNCKKELSCGCKSCAERPAKFKRNIMEGDTIECPYCQFKSSFDVWLDYEYSQYDKKISK